MIRVWRLAALSALCGLALGLAGCGGGRGEREARGYAGLVRDAVSLYGRVEPLRASSLGMTRSDSLLFTFSDAEIADALYSLRKLESRYSSFGASRLPDRDIDNIELIAYWLRGEIFALGELKTYRTNPLLYCWAAEEALWGLPSRTAPPYPGELATYRARLRKIPSLFSSARRLLANPAETHARFAKERLDTIAAQFGHLEEVVSARYGESPAAELGEALRSVESFRGFVADTLLSRSIGSAILGTEYLSKIYLYDELLNADPNTLIAKAENLMRRLQSLKGSFERRIEYEKSGGKLPRAAPILPRQGPAGAKARPAPVKPAAPLRSEPRPVPIKRQAPPSNEPLGTRIERLLGELTAETATTYGAKTGPLEVVYPAHLDYPVRFSKLPEAVIPPAGPLLSQVSYAGPFGAPKQCRPYAFFSRGAAALDDDELRLLLLRALPGVLEPDADRCASRDTLRAIFSSEVYREAWFYLAARDRTANLKAPDPALDILLLDDEIRALALMVVVFRFHGGALTSEEAADYLVLSAGMTRDEAERSVLAASVSPGLAYRGIAMVLMESLTETILYVSGTQRPEQQLRALLLEHRDLPIPFIEKMIQKD
jgi:hypothetical protein